MKIFESELKVMEVLWDWGELTAGQLSKILNEQIGWNRNTTYTVVKKLVEKGAVERMEPGFHCRARISREEVRQAEADDLIDRLFGGSAELFLSAYLGGKHLKPEELEALRKLVEELQ